MGYFFTIIYVILIYLRPQEYVESIRGFPLLDIFAGVAIAAVFLAGDFSSDKFRRSAINYLIIAFWLDLSITWMFNGWFGGVLFTFQNFGKVVITYFLIVLTVDTKAKLRLFAWVMILMATWLAVQGIVQFYTGVGLTGGEALQRGDIIQARGIGIFADPNDLAINIVPMVAFLLPSFHKGFLSRTWLTGFILLIPLVTGIAYTRSRGGLMAVGIVGWMYLRRRVGNIISVFGLVLIFGALAMVPRFDVNVDEGDTGRARLDHWAYGLSLLKSHPLFGVGKGGFTEDYSHTAHNSFILVLGEAGIIGGFIWICMLYCAFRHIWLIRRHLERAPPWLASWLNAVEAALVGWLVAAFFLSQTYKYLSFILLAMIVATLTVLKRLGYELGSEHAWTNRQTAVGIGLTVVGIVVMHVAVKFLWALGA